MFFLLAIEDDYTGPSLEEGKVNLQFMTDLIKTFKNQKLLHRKHAYKVRLICIHLHVV